VSFSGQGYDHFSPRRCTLTAAGATASCQVSYMPADTGPGLHPLTASYHGDSGHLANSALTTVVVRHP
jgi:hypothetical protein